jgi:hypothetical protein
MAKAFYIKTDELVNLSLALQRINDVALPFAVQNTLNIMVKIVKKDVLIETTNDEFDVKRRTFFTANSAYKTYKAKDFGYNISRLKAEVGMVEARKPHDKATEQIGHQETATPIDRSINPLGTKPKSKAVIDLLSKKPEVYEKGNNTEYLRTIARAYKRKAGVIFSDGKKGTLRKINKFQRRKKPTKRNPYRYVISTKPVASYIKQGKVKLTKKRPFLTLAVNRTLSKHVGPIFKNQAEDQIKRAMARKGIK